jgi:putative ABC transport system permease protein
MAMGAQQTDILKLILRKGLTLTAAGIVIGVTTSFSLTRLLASQIWGVSVADPWTYVTVVIVRIVVGVSACLNPARRAVRIDPIVALRNE